MTDSMTLRNHNSVFTKKFLKPGPPAEPCWWVLIGLRWVFAPFSQDLEDIAHRGPIAFKTNSSGEEHFETYPFSFFCDQISLSHYLLFWVLVSASEGGQLQLKIKFERR